MFLPIKIGARSSKLARVQIDEILRLLGKPVEHAITLFETQGDKDKATPLPEVTADDFFTDSIDQALLNGAIDVAIHSAKDLPRALRPGLDIFALTAPADTTDAWVAAARLRDMPPGARVGTSSVLREAQVRKLRPDVNFVPVRGTIQERLALLEQGKVDGLIIATCALKRLGLGHLIQEELPWEGAPLQGQLAVVGRSHDDALRGLFTPIDVRATYGRVVLVGAGPGDPELITLKGVRALERADCVFYDYLADRNLLKFAPNAEHIYAGKRKGDHTLSQEELSRMLRDKAMQGRNIVRLKGGDPLIFGRGADEILYLNAYHINVEVVPGVSSATGIPSSLGVPLTARRVSSSVAFVSGHEEDEDARNPTPIEIPSAGTIVFLMGLTKLKHIIQSLKAKGWPATTPMLVVGRGSRIDERIVRGTVQDIERLTFQGAIKPPALIIAGDTVNFYQERRKKVLLHCGTNPELYHDLGHIVPLPLIEIKPVQLTSAEQARLNEDFVRSDLVILTSPNAVEHFMTLIIGLRSLADIRRKAFAVIGKHTQQVLEEYGVSVEIVSREETAQGLFKALLELVSLKGKRILFPRSSLPNPFLKETLEKHGALVAEWAVYNNVKPPKRPLPQVDIEGVIFTSPSTVTNFLADYGKIPAHWDILCKGPVTEAALKEAGYPSTII